MTYPDPLYPPQFLDFNLNKLEKNKLAASNFACCFTSSMAGFCLCTSAYGWSMLVCLLNDSQHYLLARSLSSALLPVLGGSPTKLDSLRLFGMCIGRVGMCIGRVRPKYPADDVPGLWQFTVRHPGGPDQGLKPNWPLAATTPLRRTKFRFSDNCKKGQALWVKAGQLESTVFSRTRYLLFRMYLRAGDVSSNVWCVAAS